jgi:hypothetical protein
MKLKVMAAFIVGSLAMVANSETNLVISSFPGNGKLSWSNHPGAIQYRVEWAPTVNGSWTNSWEALNNLAATGSTYTVQVPMFYRLVAMFPDYARLLLHCDGTNGAVNFPDEAGAHPVVAFGEAQVSTSQSRFGGTAVYFDGSGDYLETADSADFEPGDQAFAIIRLWWWASMGGPKTSSATHPSPRLHGTMSPSPAPPIPCTCSLMGSRKGHAREQVFRTGMFHCVSDGHQRMAVAPFTDTWMKFVTRWA